MMMNIILYMNLDVITYFNIINIHQVKIGNDQRTQGE